MSKSFSYPNKGTCSKETHIVLNDDHTIESIEVIGGCNGNLKGISRLLKLSETELERWIHAMCGAGLMGLECYHNAHTPATEAFLRRMARRYGLLVTGGSDFHGANHGKPHPVGACVTEDDQIARIEALARKRRGGAL